MAKKKLRGPPRTRQVSDAEIRRFQIASGMPTTPGDQPLGDTSINQEALWLRSRRGFESRREFEMLLKRRLAGQRAKAGRAGNAARRLIAAEIIEAIAPDARRYRRLYPDAPLTAVMNYLRTQRDLDIKDWTLRQYLHRLGLK